MLRAARIGPDEPIIRVPLLGLSVRVRVPGEARGMSPTVIETMNAAGLGPPLLRRAEAEIVQIVTGRFLFEVNGQRFAARRGDLVCVPAGASRAFVNVTGTGARQQVTIYPGIDALGYYAELAALFAAPPATESAPAADDHVRRFCLRWGIEFLGAPLALPALDELLPPA